MQKRTFLTTTQLAVIDYPFTPRGLIIINRTDADCIAYADNGDEFPCPGLVVATWSLPPTLNIRAQLQSAPTNAKNCNVIVTDEPTLNGTSQLATLANVGGGVTQIAYAEITAGVACGAARTNIVSTGAFNLDALTTVIYEWFIPNLAGSATSSGLLNISEDGTDIGDVWRQDMVAGSSNFPGVHGMIERSLAAGSHTIILQGRATAGTMTANAGAGGAGVFRPAFIRVSSAGV